jgi:malate dehydrogenase
VAAPFIAVVGGGPLGGALAHKLATRGRVAEIRLIDAAGDVARGKALDILQASPVERFSTRVTTADSIHAAAGAHAIVVADAAGGQGEHTGEAALSLLRQLVAIADAAPLVLAGAGHRELIGRAVSELHVPRSRVLGTAPVALESAVRALAGLALDASGVEIQLRVFGVPPRAAVVAWEEATAFGQPITRQLGAHQIAALAARIPGLWPPGPYALASAAARVVEGIANGSRRRFSCFVALDRGPRRDAVGAMPVEIGPGGIVRVLEPVLSAQERTLLENGIEKG